MRASVIATVKEEETSIGGLLDSLLAQRMPPEEIIIVDGGSKDRTVEIIDSYRDRLPLKLMVRPGFTISQGRNAAIEEAKGEIIASTDAGVILDPGWLEHILEPFAKDPSVDVVGGFFAPDPRNAWETALAATVLPSQEGIDPARFLPSSRSVAFKKEAWKKVGGYPEWLDFCEDLILDFKLKDRGAKFLFAPQAIVYLRPRQNLADFFLQYYRYARGDGKADLWRRRHAIRYLSYILAGPLLLAAGFVYPVLWGILLLGTVIYLWTPYKRLLPALKRLSPIEATKAVFLVPIIRATGDIAKMLGYPVGVCWRLIHHPPPWRN